MTLDEFLTHFKGVRPSGDGYSALCPAHDDHNPSLSITEKDGNRLLYCHAGCPLDDILSAAGLARPDLYTDSQTRPEFEATYDYLDEDGTLLYQVVRKYPKGFFQRQPDGRDGWINNLDGVPRVLYRLPGLQGKDTVWIVEGEKDADQLWQVNIAATTSPGGAGQWLDKYSSELMNAGVKTVIVVPDNDDKGRRHGRKVAESCHAAGLEVAVAQLTDVPETGGDVSDFLARHSLDELKALVEHAPPFFGIAEASGPVSPKTTKRPQAPWPKPMGPAAYHGLIGDIVRVIEPHTEADPAPLLGQCLVAFGNAIGRKAHFLVEADKHYANLFVLVVGDTSKARKGTSLGYIRRLFRSVDCDWDKDRVVNGLSSGEGLIWQVRDPVTKMRSVKGRPNECEEVTEDHGVKDKRLLVVESEFARVLKVIGRDGNTLSPVVRQAWDGGSLNTLTKNSPARATDAHISIIAHITADELRRLLRQTEAGNGFGNRFLPMCAKRSKWLPEGGSIDQEELASLADRLQDVVEFAREVSEMPRDGEARALWRKVYRKLSSGRPGLLGAMTGRAEAQVTRLSCLYALADKSLVVRVEHLQAALEVWRYCFESARRLFGDATGDGAADHLLQALKEAGPEGLTQTKINHQVFQKNRSAADLKALLGRLEAQALIWSMADDSSPTRPTTRWFALDPTDWEGDTGDERVTGEERPDDINDLSGLTIPPQGDKSSKSFVVDGEVPDDACDRF